MRTLQPEEEEKVLRKLQLYIGDNKDELLKENGLYYNNQRILLISEEMLKSVSQIKRKELVACGTIIGKITKHNNFRVTVTAIHALEKYAINKAWIKSSAEMNFLYGNNALKSHIHKISEEIPMNGGVFVYNQSNTPLGFGIVAVPSANMPKLRGGDIIVINQADNGEYIRKETMLA